MKLHTDPQDVQRISAYDRHSVMVSGTRLASPFLITADRLLPDLDVPPTAALRWSDLEPLIGDELQILLLGTGARQQFPDSALYAEMATRGIGLEVMDSAAACRTFNILVAEGRRVAALIVVGD